MSKNTNTFVTSVALCSRLYIWVCNAIFRCLQRLGNSFTIYLFRLIFLLRCTQFTFNWLLALRFFFVARKKSIIFSSLHSSLYKRISFSHQFEWSHTRIARRWSDCISKMRDEAKQQCSQFNNILVQYVIYLCAIKYFVCVTQLPNRKFQRDKCAQIHSMRINLNCSVVRNESR